MSRIALLDPLMDKILADFPTEFGSRASSRQPSPDQVAAGDFLWAYSMDANATKTDHNGTFDIHILSFRDYSAVQDTALLVEEMLLGYPIRMSTGDKVVVIDRVDVDSAMAEVPWDADSRVTRFTGTYTLASRARHRS